jgi:hypothetical protein
MGDDTSSAVDDRDSGTPFREIIRHHVHIITTTPHSFARINFRFNNFVKTNSVQSVRTKNPPRKASEAHILRTCGLRLETGHYPALAPSPIASNTRKHFTGLFPLLLGKWPEISRNPSDCPFLFFRHSGYHRSRLAAGCERTIHGVLRLRKECTVTSPTSTWYLSP